MALTILRRLLHSTERRFDVVLARGWRVSRLDEERHLRRLLTTFDVDCVFDVGANEGQFVEMLRDAVGYQGPVISFEPNPPVFARLRDKAAADPEWQVQNIGLGLEAGTLTLHVYESSDLSSMRPLDPAAGHQPKNALARDISVPVKTLASVLDELRGTIGFRRPFLKIDTQGFDLEVARGAGGRLREFVGLQSEIAFQPLYQGAPDYRAAIEYFQEAGFVLSGLFPIHDVHFPELVEMDCVMVRRDLAGEAGRS
jgi:FkbM family methyltransferase